ncbi:MAG: putative acyltransferase [Actinomycetia bacterium]|nr:putative acyltransferase [Actinomycetes bacterium]
MPKPVGEGQRYLPGLDGLRAIAVAVVVAYHLGLGWAGGGLLGVGIFFTLSGYLITDILVGQWRARGRINLKDFWIRRARRLLPALFVVLAVVAAWAAIAYPGQMPSLRGDIVAAALYVSNWWFIAQNASYFARFGPPSPLGHLWSLAVEEQFYLIWPWIVLAGGVLFTRKMKLTTRQAGFAAIAVTLALAAASFVALALSFHPGLDPTRAYEGTDTRAGGLLIGAALALAWPTRRARPGRTATAAGGDPATATASPNRSSRLATTLLDGGGVIGLVVIALMIWRSSEYSAFLYQGGLLLLSAATALVIAAVVHPATRLGRVLGVGPLRWLGVRSYGIYLWHYPVIVLTASGANPSNAPMSGARQVLTAAACVAVAGLSWALIEDPIRSRRMPRAPRLAAAAVMDAVRWARGGWLRALTAATMAVGVGGVAAVGALVLSGSLPSGSQPRGTLAGDSQPGGAGLGQGLAAAGGGTGKSGTASSTGSAAAPSGGLHGPGSLGTGLVVGEPQASVVSAAQGIADASVAGPGAAYVADLPEPAPHTSCKSVIHIGDSTSDGLISSDYLPDAAQRIPARYAQIGVTSVHMEVVGGTSIVEEYDNRPNAYDVAKRYRSQGYKGCWVIALGTNDTADVAVGSNVGLAGRITRMMSVIGNQPVMWITVKSLLSTGPYSEQDMLEWDQALYAAAKHHPNMKIYNWASVVQTPWYINDGIHFTSAGYAARGELIADALAAAFPAPTVSSLR